MHPLIEVDELAALLVTDHPPVVLDVRWRLTGPPAEPDYRAAHLPGAVFVDLDTDLADPPGEKADRGRHPLPDPHRMQETLRRWGVRQDSAVVAYDDGNGMSAARAWWVLRWAGLPDVRVLNGGWRAWTAAGGVVTTTVPRPAPGDVVVRAGGMLHLDVDGAARLARSGLLLDARAAERYRGEVEPVDRAAGHIPGAVSAPTTGNVDEHGRFLPADALRERFRDLGVRPEQPVGVYCGSGITAAHEVLALALAGHDAALYPGSWSEWVSDPGRPIATGERP